MAFSCYILRCADGTLYTGWSSDLERRLKEHNAGRGARYTRGRGPVEVVYVETFANQSAAMKQEAAIKKLGRKEKLELITAYAGSGVEQASRP